jgi:hypothetical protein
MSFRTLSAFEFGRLVAVKTAQAKSAQDLDNELSPDAVNPENMALAKAMLQEKNPAMSKRPVMVQMPTKAQEPMLPHAPKNRAVPQPVPRTLAKPSGKPQDYAAEYAAWRNSIGVPLSPENPGPFAPKSMHTPPAQQIPLDQLGGEQPIKLPPNIR